MKHILEGHHPKHFNPKTRIKDGGETKETTLFPNMTEKDIEQVIIKIAKQESDRISQRRGLRSFQLGRNKGDDIIIDGRKYVVGFRKGYVSNGMHYWEVGQFYPKIDLP